MKITINYHGIPVTYTPTPGVDLSKLDIISIEGEEEDKKKYKQKVYLNNSVIEYIPVKPNPDAKPTPKFKGGDNTVHIDPKNRKITDVEITSDKPYEAFHSINENFWYNDNGEVMPDDELFRFNAEYVQLCKRKFDCYLPNYTNKSGLSSNNLIVDMSENTGPFDMSYGSVRDNSNGMELTRVAVIDIAKYMYEGVPVRTHHREDAFHILTIANDTLDKYIGAIPVAPTTFIAPEEWFEPLLYLRESIMEARPGLIQRMATDFDHAGKPRRPKIQKIRL